jgi:hypothetical protein
MTSQSAFSRLELFVPVFPGDPKSDRIHGFAELRSTLIRSLHFFWPSNHFKMTVVLDDTVYSTLEERNNMTSEVMSMVHDKFGAGISVEYTPRSNLSLFNGHG